MIFYKVDRSTMYHSQEARLPFLDSRLIEYLCKLPSSFKFNFLKERIIKALFKNKLPKNPQKESGFNTPMVYGC